MKQLTLVCTILALAGCQTVAGVRDRPPAEAAALCRELMEPANDSVDAMVIGYVDTIDAYRDCALRHKALSEWAR